MIGDFHPNSEVADDLAEVRGHRVWVGPWTPRIKAASVTFESVRVSPTPRSTLALLSEVVGVCSKRSIGVAARVAALGRAR